MKLFAALAVAAALVLAGCSLPTDDSLRTAIDAHRSPLAGLAMSDAPAVPDAAGRSAVRTDVEPAGPHWLALAEQARGAAAPPQSPAPATRAASDQAASSLPPPGAAYVPWPQRRGPAYPGDFWRSMGRDGKELLPIVWDDTKATATNPVALVGIALAGASGIAIAASDADDNIGDQTSRHGHKLDHCWDNVFDVGGNPGTHFAVAGAAYLLTLYRGDTKHYEVSKTMISALAINGLTTLALKGLANTESPNGDPWGWPSGHTSSSFAAATVLAESYGPWVGAPAFAFAAMVGYERVDARNHDLSDVVSGAFLGIAIGHAVSQNHKARIFGMEVVPMVTSDGGVGVGLAKRW